MGDTQTSIEKSLLKLVQTLLLESSREHAVAHLSLKADLTQDLGIDSLGRVELFLRIEKAFGIRLPDTLMAEAKTLAELKEAIEIAKPTLFPTLTTRIELLEPICLDLSSDKTLGEVLFRYAQETPTRPHIYLQDEQSRETIIRYDQLFEGASRVARGLCTRGIKPGETVALMLPTSRDFFYSFFGVLLAGGVPVPIYPPFRLDKIEEYIKREANILRNAEVRVLITFDKAKRISGILRAFIASLISVDTTEELMLLDGVLPQVQLDSTDPALIQYTSGSTSLPKGVLLTHQNLLANIRAIGSTIELSPTDRAVSWLPLYHDMGLIGSWLFSLYHGIPITILSPLSFLSRPERWLWAIHTHRATLSAAPNFAYELCVRKIEEESLEGLDLSSWRLALNAAEAVNPKTLRDFVKKFSKYGFSEKAFSPVYGLAESTVGLTFPPLGRPPRIDKIARKPFEQTRRAIPATANDKNILEFVACGGPIEGHEIRIVDESNNLLEERHIGLLQFRGPSSLQGYYRNPKATAAIYHDGWWDSGDLAYLAEGEVFITGRKKDVIIKAGRNIHPEELEEITSGVKGIRRGCVVAFGVADRITGTEKIVVVAETHEQNKMLRDQMIAEIVQKIALATEMPPDHVILVPPKIVPKTSSGKLRRANCKELYLKGLLGQKHWSSGLQMFRLWFFWLKEECFRLSKNIAKTLYSCYVGFLLVFFGIIAWSVVMRTSPKRGRRFCKGWLKLLFWLSACPLRVRGQEHLAHDEPVIFVSNHASYVDAVVLLTLLPENTLFVGKKELLQAPILRSFMKKFRFLTVDRLDFSQSLSDVERILAIVKEGASMMLFPEGTFTYATGLRPFRFGAFKIAAEAMRPLCPIALKGTRAILRDDFYLMTPGKITVTIAPSIQPQNNSWQEVVRLHTEARNEIARHCGEPIIDLIAANLPAQPP